MKYKNLCICSHPPRRLREAWQLYLDLLTPRPTTLPFRVSGIKPMVAQDRPLLFLASPAGRGTVPLISDLQIKKRKIILPPSPYTQNFHTSPNTLISSPKFLACPFQPRGFYVLFLCQIKQDR